jgi:hypothetical protein
MPSGSPIDRFWMKVEKTDSCWNWTAGKNQQGYGTFFPERKTTIAAHKFIYQYTYGKLPDKIELDHLCKNRSCVRLEHLEPVTHGENVRRGLRTKKICQHGIGETNCYSGCRSAYSKRKYLEKVGK